MRRLNKILWEAFKVTVAAVAAAVALGICNELGWYPDKDITHFLMTIPAIPAPSTLGYLIPVGVIALLLLFAEHWLVPLVRTRVGASGQRRAEANAVSPSRQSSGEYWPLRRLFGYLAPHLPLTAHRVLPGGGIVTDIDERWKPIGDEVLKALSIGRLHAIGREIVKGTKRLHAAPIPSDYWAAAKFTYWFLDDELSVWDVGNGRSFSEVEVNASESTAIWPDQPWPDFTKWDKVKEFRLYERPACGPTENLTFLWSFVLKCGSIN